MCEIIIEFIKTKNFKYSSKKKLTEKERQFFLNVKRCNVTKFFKLAKKFEICIKKVEKNC